MVSYLHAYVVFVILVYIGESYLDYRQRQKFKITKRPEEITYVNDEEFKKAQAYGLDKSTFGFFQSAFSTMKTLAIVTFLFWPWLWSLAGSLRAQLGYDDSHTHIQSCIFFILEMLIDTCISLPWSWYSTFVLEEKHGFNKQTYVLFVTDMIKTIFLYIIIGCPILSVFLTIVEWGGPHMHIYLWGFLFCVQIIALTIYPTWIQPLFNKVVPLEEGSLRTSIEKLAASISFPLTQLYVIDGSKRSAHSNAYFYGFFRNKRIVIYDTLIQQSTEEEVVAVLGHELGHWSLNHTIKNLIMMQLQTFFMFWMYGQVVHNTQLFADFGFKTQPTYVGLLLFQLIYSPAQHVFSFLMNVISRKAEFEADAFAVKLGYGKQLRSGLIKLQQQNKGTMIADPWYSTYHHSHPPVLQRLAAIDAALAKKE